VETGSRPRMPTCDRLKSELRGSMANHYDTDFRYRFKGQSLTVPDASPSGVGVAIVRSRQQR
jgi:hypothetical protein